MTMDTDVDTDANEDADPVEESSGGCSSSIGIGASSIVLIAIVCGAVVFFEKKKV